MDEDKVLVELIQAQPPLPQRRMEVNADIASIRVRQIVETMVAEERGRTPVRPGFAVHHAGVANNVGGERWPG
jgi:hypothetical protein